MKYTLLILLIVGSCRSKKKSTHVAEAVPPGYSALVSRHWTTQRHLTAARPAAFVSDTAYHFRKDSILIRTYDVPDRFSSRGFRRVKEIIRYYLRGDTMVCYDGKPIKGLVRQLNDSAMVIDYPGYSTRLHPAGPNKPS